MRWLILQSDGVHKLNEPNWYLRECYGFQYALRCLGHEADIVGPGHHTPIDGTYDYVLVLENYNTAWLPDLTSIAGRKVQWIVDAHYQSWDVYRKISQQCDVILHATRSLIEPYSYLEPTKKHVWFPCCIDERYFNGIYRPKIHDAVFVGSRHPNRENFISEMVKSIGLQCISAIGQDMIEKVAQAKIHVNQPISVDINARVFETIGIGTCLMTSYDPALVDLGFRDCINCSMYKTNEDAVESYHALMKSGAWEEIGRSGFELSRKHTIRQRLSDFLKGEDHAF